MREARQQLVYDVVKRARNGESQRAIARAVGIAPKTVRKILEAEEKRRNEGGQSALDLARPPPRAARASKLDLFQPQIEAWLEQFEDLTAIRLHEKLIDAGYQGGYTIVRERLKALRAERKPKQAFLVVETAPGQQAQFDWSPYTLLGCGLKVQLWSCTLGWSRGRSFLSSEDTKQTTILTYLQHSFELFGGVPLECVTDSMPGVVDRWECNRPLLNLRFVDFAAYFRFAAHIAPRGMGRYKGKVERPFWFAEQNLLNGRRFSSREEFAEVLAWWATERAMKRPHPTTGRPLFEMLAEERPYLQPLPRHPYDTRDVVLRLVDTQAFIQHETNFYPVPEKLIGELVYVLVGADRLEIFDRGVHRVAEHERLADGAGQRIKDTQRAHRGRYDLELLGERVAAWGLPAEAFARRVRAKKRYAGAELGYLLGLQLTWSADDIVKAIEHATRYDAYDVRAVERILEARFTPRRLAEQIADSTRGRIHDAMKHHPAVEQRSLTSYATLRTGDPPAPLALKQEEPRGEDTEEPDT